MLEAGETKTYVADVRIPTFFHQICEVRKRIPNPVSFQITKGYWKLRSLNGPSDESGFAEFVLTIAFVSEALKDAENHALQVGKDFSVLLSGFSGHPVEPPILHRIALVDSRECLLTQTNYWYAQKLSRQAEFNQTTQYRLQEYIGQVSSMEKHARYQLQSAIHWYVTALGADDPTISIVAAWTGLECIGKILDSKFHPNGNRARCEMCQNQAGKKRDRKIAGIEHIFCWINRGILPETELEETVANDLVEHFDAEEARQLRNDIVHGLQTVNLLTQRCSEVRRHLYHVLNASIQNAMDELSPSGIAGHYEFHPEGRVSLKVSEELAKKPFFGQWIEGFRVCSEITEELPYVASIIPTWNPPSDVVRLIEYKSQEEFARDAEIYQVSDQSVLDGIPNWHSRPDEPEWERIVDTCPF